MEEHDHHHQHHAHTDQNANDQQREKHIGHQKAHDETARHDEHAGHHTDNFLKRFWICVALTVPILLLSHMIQLWLGFSLAFAGDRYLSLLLSSIVYFYGGRPFLVGLVRELKNRAPGMMTLVAVAITTAFLYSTAVVFGLNGMDFFWELATLIDIMLLGHWLEMKSQMASS